jgi:hypothetical protein
MLGFIFSTDESPMSLLIKLSTHQELLYDWSIYSTVLQKIGWLKMNDRLPDVTPNGMSLDVSVSPKNIC